MEDRGKGKEEKARERKGRGEVVGKRRERRKKLHMVRREARRKQVMKEETKYLVAILDEGANGEGITDGVTRGEALIGRVEEDKVTLLLHNLRKKILV